MRISDWSSDVCSSDLLDGLALPRQGQPIQQRSCGAHSAGIWKPSSTGLRSAMGFTRLLRRQVELDVQLAMLLRRDGRRTLHHYVPALLVNWDGVYPRDVVLDGGKTDGRGHRGS